MRHLLVVIALLGTALHGMAQNAAVPARIVAIGDIHGAYTEFVDILKRTGLVNDALAWSGGTTTLVQTGDYTDRGADVRKVLDLLIRLEGEARAAGGQVVTLLGNHEVMNLIGDWRDVTPAICASFATAKSEARREDAYRRYARLRSSLTPAPALYTQTREEWMLEHPPGCLEYREALLPSGTYGRWLRDKPIAGRVGDSLFMHAGINPAGPIPRSLNEVNDRTRSEIRRFEAHRQRLADRRLALTTFTLQEILEVSAAELRHASIALAQSKADGLPTPAFDLPIIRESQELMKMATWSLVDPEGPLWFRGYAQWDETESSPVVFRFLDAMKLSRIVVGHTPTPGRRITPRFADRVLLIDTGMLTSVYDGNPAALDIRGQTLKAIYPDEEVELSARPATPVPQVLQR